MIKDLQFPIKSEDRAVFAIILARYSAIICPELEQEEVSEIIEEFLAVETLDIKNCEILADAVLDSAGITIDDDFLSNYKGFSN